MSAASSQQNHIEKIGDDYDKHPYPSLCYTKTHPNYLTALAYYHGLKSANPFQCRVLEIGCSNGANLLSFAEQHPNSRIIGIDVSKKHIAQGQKYINHMGLENIILQHCSITDLLDDDEKFDYIICHGVFSWVSDFVRDSILAYIQRNLHNHGLAYISYNCYPGWANLKILRDIMRYREQQCNKDISVKNKIADAFALIKHIGQKVDNTSDSYQDIINEELNTIKQYPKGYLHHEFYHQENNAFYIHEFVDTINRYDLDYLCDTNIASDEIRTLPSQQSQWFKQRDLTKIETLQYLDYFNNRRFRSSVIAHKKQIKSVMSDANYLKNLYITANIVIDKEQQQHRPSYPLDDRKCYFKNNHVTFHTAHPLLTGLYLILVDNSNMTMLGSDIINKVKELPGCDIYKNKSNVDDIIINELHNAVKRNLAFIDSQQIIKQNTLPDYPDIGKFAQAQLHHQSWSIFRHGNNIDINNVEKLIIPLLNGQYSISDIDKYCTDINNFNHADFHLYDDYRNTIDNNDIILNIIHQHMVSLLEKLHHQGCFDVIKPHQNMIFANKPLKQDNS